MAKKSMSVSVSEEVLEKFRKHCDGKCINKSGLVEKLLLKYLDGWGKG